MDLELCRKNIMEGKICSKYNVSNIFTDNTDEINLKISKISYVFSLLSVFVANDLVDNKPFLGKLQKEINDITKENITKKQIYSLIVELNKHKETLKTFMVPNKRIDSKYYVNIEQKGGFFSRMLGWDNETGIGTKILDIIDLILDLVGFIPGLGIPVDAAGAILSLVRGRYLDALFSVINMIPMVGSFVGTPGKYITKFIRAGKKIRKIKDKYDDAQDLLDKGQTIRDFRDNYYEEDYSNDYYNE
jgi:hypothetical protein